MAGFGCKPNSHTCMSMQTILNSVGLLLHTVILMHLHLQSKKQELHPWGDKHQHTRKANMEVLDWYSILPFSYLLIMLYLKFLRTRFPHKDYLIGVNCSVKFCVGSRDFVIFWAHPSWEIFFLSSESACLENPIVPLQSPGLFVMNLLILLSKTYFVSVNKNILMNGFVPLTPPCRRSISCHRIIKWLRFEGTLKTV